MNTQQIAYEWSEALKQPFNAARLAALHAEYQEALRLDAAHKALYAEQRAIVAVEREAARAACRAELADTPKAELMARLNVTDTRRWTRERLTDWLCDAADARIEHEHSRVQRLWAERQGGGA